MAQDPRILGQMTQSALLPSPDRRKQSFQGNRKDLGCPFIGANDIGVVSFAGAEKLDDALAHPQGNNSDDLVFRKNHQRTKSRTLTKAAPPCVCPFGSLEDLRLRIAIPQPLPVRRKFPQATKVTNYFTSQRAPTNRHIAYTTRFLHIYPSTQ